MQPNLDNVLVNVKDWLKFAESKNAALFAGNSGLIFGITSVLPRIPIEHTLLHLYLLIAIPLFILSSACCLISFVPRLKLEFFTRKLREPRKDDNLLFYHHIANYSSEDYLTKILNNHSHEFSKLELDYAQQIIAISQIALWKYWWFKFALFITLTVVATPIISVIVFCYRERG